MITTQQQFEVQAGPDAVFSFVAADFFENQPKWALTTLTREGTGAVAIGTAGQEIRKVPMGKAVSKVKVTALEAPARFSYTTDSNVDVESWAPKVVDHTSLERTTDWSRWVFPTAADPPPIPPLQCRPNGTCDPCSIFFKYVLPGPSCDPLTPPGVPIYDRCGKLAAMPLGGAITTRADWN